MKEYKILIGIALLVLAFLLLKQANMFSITENDLPLVSEWTINPGESFDKFSNFSIVNQTIKFNIGSVSKSVIEGKNSFFMLDDENATYDTFPDTTDGTHTIIKYKMNLINNQSQINIQKFSKTYDLIVKTVYKNVTIANQTFYIPGNTTYLNVTTYQNVTVEKQVIIDPTPEYLFNKYKMVIIGLVGIGIVFYLTRRKK